MKKVSTEDQLVIGCRRGDRRAQYELYNRYSQAMGNVCHRMMKSQDQAEDVLQEAFVDVFKKIDTFRGESTVGAWIKRIVVHKCINKLRGRRLDIQQLDDERHDILVDEDRDVYRDHRIDQIKSAINDLPEGFRLVTSLYLYEGYDHGEIAQIMGISESTSKSQYHRAKAKIRSTLAAVNIN